MMYSSLSQVVEQFAQRMAAVPDADLERTWVWQSYDEEGVRFAFFRTYEDLRDLAARLHHLRSTSEFPVTEAQRSLAQYHLAYRDFQAALLGLTAEQMNLVPAENEWPVRRAVAHILGADLGFYVLTRYALDNIRGSLDPSTYAPSKIPDEVWPKLTGLDEAAYDALMNGPVEGLLEYQQMHHQRVLDAFASISAEELEMLSLYWEDEPYKLRFRLHRFDSHMRQHTIQIDKTLTATGLQPGEARRLLRLVYSALAEAEGALIGYEPADTSILDEAARTIQTRGAEVSGILQP